jgi:hypothetical protein
MTSARDDEGPRGRNLSSALLADLREFLIRAIREHEDEWLAIEA